MGINYTWEEKLYILKSIAPSICLIMRSPGDWFVSAGMSIKDGCMLIGKYGNGRNPQEAVEQHFDIYTKVAYPTSIRVNHNSGLWRWDRFTWVRVSD